MIAPKTPLPWLREGRLIFHDDPPVGSTGYLGQTEHNEDAAYAVHAADVLPEVVAALREAREMIEADRHGMAEDAAIDGRTALLEQVDAALAKAEGAPEGDG